MPFAVTATSWRALPVDSTEEDLAPGEVLVDEIPADTLTGMDNATAYSELLLLSSNAIATLAARVSALQVAVDAELATEDEAQELTSKQVELKAWRKYGVLLARVPAQAGWPLSPDWPETP